MSDHKYRPAGESRSARRARKKQERKAKQARKQAAYKPTIHSVDVRSKEFLLTYEWRVVRMQALKKYGPRCQCCGATPATGATINVDHIKPRRLFPELALSLDNLQILCHECNHGKGNWDATDWRTEVADVYELPAEQRAHLASI